MNRLFFLFLLISLPFPPLFSQNISSIPWNSQNESYKVYLTPKVTSGEIVYNMALSSYPSLNFYVEPAFSFERGDRVFFIVDNELLTGGRGYYYWIVKGNVLAPVPFLQKEPESEKEIAYRLNSDLWDKFLRIGESQRAIIVLYQQEKNKLLFSQLLTPSQKEEFLKILEYFLFLEWVVFSFEKWFWIGLSLRLWKAHKLHDSNVKTFLVNKIYSL